jgi:uncharacterized protein YpuA (DUF1002 family)
MYQKFPRFTSLSAASRLKGLIIKPDGRGNRPQTPERMMFQMKKLISVLLALVFCSTMLAGVALADGESRIVLGQDLTNNQEADMLDYFGVNAGDVKTLYLTHEEEVAWLGALLPADKLGTKSLSSLYIKAAAEGSGLKIETKNINWITPEMYMAALTTAGIVDADIKVAAPIKVSGTAALAGIFKAYEDITGITLSRDAKEVAAQELVLTGQLSDILGSTSAEVLVNDLKAALDQVKGKSDDEIKDLIRQTAKDNNVSINDAQVTQLLNLVKRISQLNIDPALLVQQAKQLQDLTKQLDGMQKSAEGFGGWISGVWKGFTDWLASIFG